MLRIKKAPYNIGDKVIVRGEQSGRYFNYAVGVIISNYENIEIGVQFDEKKDFLHSCSGKGKDKQCFKFCNPKQQFYEYDEVELNNILESMSKRISESDIDAFVCLCCSRYSNCSKCPLKIIEQFSRCYAKRIYTEDDIIYNSFYNAYLETKGGTEFVHD